MIEPIPSRAVLLLLAMLAASACGRGMVPFNPTTPVLLQAQVEPQALRAAIVRALSARRFTTESEAPGAIVARMQARGQHLRLRIDYSPTDYRVTYLESAGLGHRVDPDGTATISRRYDAWIASLQQTIAAEIQRPEREAREAIEEQRRHEVAVLEQQRRAAQEQRDHQARQAERDRQTRLEEQRLRTAQARAEADARRPIIVDRTPYVVDAMVVAPRQRVRSRFGAIRVRGSVRAHHVRGQAEGDVDSASLGLPESCRGFYAGTPEHLLEVGREVEYLRLETESGGDPTLMVVADDGAVYCDDDGGEGVNARIEGSFPPGTYRIYVGSYRAGEATPYRLLVTGEQASPPIAQAPQGPPPPSECRTLVIGLGHSPSQMMHCEGAEPHCAETLLRAGHSPAQLMHCRGVDRACAVATLQAGHSPAQLLHCR